MHIAEFGVVLLLFVIGLELQPSRLRAMRKAVFGLGLAQVLVTTAVFTAIALALGLPSSAALVTAFALSLSSTPLVLQLLAERQQLNTHYGRSSLRDPAVPGHRRDADAGDPAAARGRAAGHVHRAAERASRDSPCSPRWCSAADTCCARCCAWLPRPRSARRSRRRRCSSCSAPRCWSMRSACRWRSAPSSPACCSPTASTATSSKPTSSRSRACCSACSSCPSAWRRTSACCSSIQGASRCSWRDC